MAGAYEPTGIFREGFTKAEVEAMLAEAKLTFTANRGEQISSWSSSGNQAVTKFNLTAAETIAECVYALQVLDSDNWPVDADRTTVSFGGVTGTETV